MWQGCGLGPASPLRPRWARLQHRCSHSSQQDCRVLGDAPGSACCQRVLQPSQEQPDLCAELCSPQASHRSPSKQQRAAPQAQGKQMSAFSACNVIQTPPCLGKEQAEAKPQRTQLASSLERLKCLPGAQQIWCSQKPPPHSPALDSRNEIEHGDAYSNNLQIRSR